MWYQDHQKNDKSMQQLSALHLGKSVPQVGVQIHLHNDRRTILGCYNTSVHTCLYPENIRLYLRTKT